MEDLVRYYLRQTSSPESARKAADGFYWMWFGWTGIDQSAQDFAAGYISHRQLRQSWQHLLFETWRDPLIVAMYSLKLLGIRVSMLTMMLPQFGVALAAALVDGLVARHVRRACGGHESATRYHQAKNWSVIALIPLTALIWLVAPLRMPVYWIFTPVLFACAWSVWTMAKYYKKFY